MAQSDPEPSSEEVAALHNAMQQPMPALPREALDRIGQAEKDAAERYDRDRKPYLPTDPAFSFLAAAVFRSMARIVEYGRVFAEEVLDANLKEYLEFSPADLVTNGDLWLQVADRVRELANELWTGYIERLRLEPTLRRVRHRLAMLDGTLDQHPEWEPGRYPEAEPWKGFMEQLSKPDSEMALLDARHRDTIDRAIWDRIRWYQVEASSRLRRTPPAQPESEIEKIAFQAKSWGEVEISFFNEHSVQITAGKLKVNRQFGDLGMADTRSGKPTLAWHTLHDLALANGIIHRPAGSARDWATQEKRMQELRTWLKDRFGIRADPLPFAKGIGYHASFKIHCGRSYQA